MNRPKLVSLFSGTGALDLAITEATGAETVAVADVCGDPATKNWPHKTPCKSPCTILAHRFPGVPNLGDVSTVNWAEFLSALGCSIQIVCAGFPCQDVSTAGLRAGLKEGTRTGLWSEVVRAIRELQPRLVILENVPGIFTAPASGDVEPCPVCLGGSADSHLRALHAVLADLAALGFDAEWVSVRASDVGAPHRRERWFLAAYPTGRPVADRARRGRNTRPLNTEVLLLPTPAVNDMGKAYTPEEWDAWTDKMKPAHGNGNGHGKSLEIEAATGKGGAHRLSPRFVEWLMGLHEGWITDVPGITRNEALKACGNGVVPQQAYAAITHMLTANEVAA